jgi:hypothetical protein
MENLIFLLTASLVLYKSSKKPTTIVIGNTNASVQFFSDAIFECTQSDTGDALYYAEHAVQGVTYGVLCATLGAPMFFDEAHAVLRNFIGRLEQPFYVLHNTGIDVTTTTASGEYQVQMTDYWQDSDSVDWKVKGYCNGRTVAVLYVKNINEIGVSDHDKFLDSFCFGKK